MGYKMWRWNLALRCIILIISEILAFDNEYLLRTKSLPNDLNFMPTLGNGHLGYTVFGNAIYMNGIYNGHGGNSRRGRIPNWLNLSVSIIHDDYINNNINVESNDNGDGDGAADDRVTEMSPLYELNLRDGYFRWRESMPKPALGLLQFEQRTYAHRFYNRALIYELLVQRTETKVPLKFKLTQSSGDASEAFNFMPFGVGGVKAGYQTTESPNPNDEIKWKILKGVTKNVEHELFQNELKTIFVILSEDLEHGKLLEMTAGQKDLYYRFILTADEDEDVARSEMKTVLALEPSELLQSHISEWNNFWESFHIQIKNNTELSHTVNAGLFYLASSLPSENSFQQNKGFYGLSPTGLGRGELDSDYEGHNFWDTEIWMFPVVLQMSDKWARDLLGYREKCLPGAQYNAGVTGYKGARFPWESAFTGTEVTNPCCPEVAANEVHITADIAMAFEKFYAFTNDENFLCENAWPVLKEISEFLIDRTNWDPATKKYHIKNVMGPDEDHENVTDSIYTNLSFKIALEFSLYVERICAKVASVHNAWKVVAENLFIPYDETLNYHPQFSGYNIGEEIKQADTILLGYPLQYQMNVTTRLNDLRIYEAVTRDSGPAMTWSMYSINFLDANQTDKADSYFLKSYENYVRKEFKVWSEVPLGYQGAANFLTGIGGFLQAIINGYAGIRVYHQNGKSVLELQRRYNLPNTNGFKIYGLYFAGARFELNIEKNGDTILKFISVEDKKLELWKENKKYPIYKDFTMSLEAQPVFIQLIQDSN